MTDDGLRTLPDDRGVDRRGRLRRLRYVPLALLTVAALAAGASGAVVKHREEEAAAREAAAAASLAEACAPAVTQEIEGEPWRDPARLADSEARFLERIVQESPAYVRGEDGWHFFNDWQSRDFSQAIGRVSLDQAQADAWADYFGELESAAEAIGSDFHVVIAPAKWDVYPERLPEWARELRGSNSFDVLRALHPELPVIDTRAALRDAAATENVYSPLNSHWTPYGGHEAWTAIADCLELSRPGEEEVVVPAVSGVEQRPDPAEFADQIDEPRIRPVWSVPLYAEPLPDRVTVSIPSGEPVDTGADLAVDMTQLPVRTTTPDAPSDDTLLVFRDSTGSALSPLWGSAFRTTVEYRHVVGSDETQDVPGIMEGVGPDRTIFLMTERYLGYPPPVLP